MRPDMNLQSRVSTNPYQEVTYFSYDINRQFHPDNRSLQYYFPPLLPVDLSKGFDTFVKWDDSTDEHLDGLLKAVILLEQKNNERVKAEIMTWRGMMTKVGEVWLTSFLTC
jgi:RAT1-interacting protein